MSAYIGHTSSRIRHFRLMRFGTVSRMGVLRLGAALEHSQRAVGVQGRFGHYFEQH